MTVSTVIPDVLNALVTTTTGVLPDVQVLLGPFRKRVENSYVWFEKVTGRSKRHEDTDGEDETFTVEGEIAVYVGGESAAEVTYLGGQAFALLDKLDQQIRATEWQLGVAQLYNCELAAGDLTFEPSTNSAGEASGGTIARLTFGLLFQAYLLTG